MQISKLQQLKKERMIRDLKDKAYLGSKSAYFNLKNNWGEDCDDLEDDEYNK